MALFDIVLKQISSDAFMQLEGSQGFPYRQLYRDVIADAYAEIVRPLQWSNHNDLFSEFLATGSVHQITLRVNDPQLGSRFERLLSRHLRHSFIDVSPRDIQEQPEIAPLMLQAASKGGSYHYLEMRLAGPNYPDLRSPSFSNLLRHQDRLVIGFRKMGDEILTNEMKIPADYAYWFNFQDGVKGEPKYIAALLRI